MGFTPPCCSHGQRSAVHPHMRGVYEGFKLDDTPHYGSSPRAWGLPLSNAEICCDCRSIPTYVGFTFPLSLWDPLTTVHPHIRGVYYSRGTAAVARNGPSPHTWGLLLGQAQFAAHVAGDKAGPSPHTWGLRPGDTRGQDDGRSIPTYVGFTIGVSACRRVVAVHPHIRGVYGKTYCGIVRVHRSIPTYVGFTPSTATSPAA